MLLTINYVFHKLISFLQTYHEPLNQHLKNKGNVYSRGFLLRLHYEPIDCYDGHDEYTVQNGSFEPFFCLDDRMCDQQKIYGFLVTLIK